MGYNKSITSALLIFACFACQQEATEQVSHTEWTSPSGISVNADSLQLKPTEGLVYYKNKPFTGTSTSTFPNGNPATSTDYMNGRKHGLFLKWFPDSTVSYQSHYNMGKQHGITKSWWSNGNLRSQSQFKEGLVHGTQTQWYNSGAKFKELNYTNGKEEGMQKAWRENGKIYSNYEARDNRIFGLKRANLCFELSDEEVQYNE